MKFRETDTYDTYFENEYKEYANPKFDFANESGNVHYWIPDEGFVFEDGDVENAD